MKRLLVLLTLLVGILAFSASAFSADVCSSCKGGVRNVPCVIPGQAAACLGFDYDTPLPAGAGYCVAATMLAPNNYKALFHICNCPDPAAFIPGLIVDVRMTILVDGASGAKGAYWSGTPAPPGVIGFSTFMTDALACASVAAFTTDFGAPAYFLSDGVTASVPLATTACTVPAANQATIMVANSGLGAGVGGYVVNGAEGPVWWIDIPPIRIDPALIASGATVQVKIELIDHTGMGICPACSLCNCTIDVAKACCGAGTGSMFFPYFSSLDAGAYWNGIAITNQTAAAGKATLTAYEKNGGVGQYIADVPADGMFVDLLENITWTVVSGTLGGSPCFIEVTTDYGTPDGFGMISNYANQESMGYLPRKPAAAVGAY